MLRSHVPRSTIYLKCTSKGYTYCRCVDFGSYSLQAGVCLGLGLFQAEALELALRGDSTLKVQALDGSISALEKRAFETAEDRHGHRPQRSGTLGFHRSLLVSEELSVVDKGPSE